MKVLLVLPSLRKTGVSQVVKDLIEENNIKQKVNYSLLILRDGYAEEETLFRKITNLYILKGKKHISISKIKQFKRVIQKIQPDIIHFHGFNSEIYIPFISNKYKVITTSHNMGKGDFVYSYGFILGQSMAFIQKHIYKKVNMIIGVSESVSQHYKKMGFNNVVTIQNGVFLYSNIKKADNVTSLERPIGIYAGNLEKRKNVEFLLNVYNDYENEHKLIVLGDDPKNPDVLKWYKKKYKNVLFLGRVDNTFPYLKLADYFISASKLEGLPMAVIEAMGMNLDLILSNIPQHLELRKEKDQNIYFFKNDDSDSLNATLHKYFDYWKPEHVSNNYEIFKKYFSASVMLDKYIEVYNKI